MSRAAAGAVPASIANIMRVQDFILISFLSGSCEPVCRSMGSEANVESGLVVRFHQQGDDIVSPQ
jgi:hypothetical protein